MENTSLAPKMRRIAGVLYGAFFLLQLLSLKDFIINGDFTYINPLYNYPYTPVLDYLNVGLALLAGVFCVWLMAGRSDVSARISLGTVTATVLIVISNFLFFNGHMNFLQSSMLKQFPFTAFVTQSNVALLSVVLFGIQIVLLILAAFFVTSAQTPAEAADEEEEDEYEEEVEAFDIEENPDVADMLEREQEEIAEQQEEDAIEEMSEEEKREMADKISQAVVDNTDDEEK